MYDKSEHNKKLRTEKITIEDYCENVLINSELKAGLLDFVAFMGSLKIKPSWYHINSWNFNYKGKHIVIVNKGKSDEFYVRVETTFSPTTMLDMIKFLPLENYNEHINSFEPCTACGNCAPGFSIVIDGKEYKNICYKYQHLNYINPTSEQFERVKKYALARMEYIKSITN